MIKTKLTYIPSSEPNCDFNPSNLNKFYFAKTKGIEGTQSVWHHTLAVIYSLEYICSLFEDKVDFKIKEALKNFPYEAGGLHDIGKISPGFQLKLPCVKKNHPNVDCSIFNQNHAKVSSYFIDNELPNNIDLKDKDYLSEIINIHHGCMDSVIVPKFKVGGDEWRDARILFFNQLQEKFGTHSFSFNKYHDLSFEKRKYLAGLLVLGDWVASSISDNMLNWTDDKIRYTVRQTAIRIFKKTKSFEKMEFKDIFGFKPNGFQLKIENLNTNNNIFLLESSMGSGKTEAALRLYYRINEKHNMGLYFGLPTMLTSNKVYQRVNSFMNNIGIDYNSQLIHGHAKYYSENNDVADWFASSNKAKILSSYGVGTVDQALLSVVNTKHFFLRTFALSNKVIIIDEVHSYDKYMIELLSAFIREVVALGSKVILLSATMPDEYKKVFFKDFNFSVDYPLITSYDGETITEI